MPQVKQYCVLLLLWHCCLQESCDKGTLDSVVSSWEGEEEGGARMLQRLLLLKDAAQGMKLLHSMNTVHGDLVGACYIPSIVTFFMFKNMKAGVEYRCD